MFSNKFLPTDPQIAEALQLALFKPVQRISFLKLPDGGRLWLKRAESLSGLMRLQKGDPLKAFLAERDALLALRGRGLPVPEPLAAGEDFFLLPDLGPTLSDLMADDGVSGAERLRAFAAAGHALAWMHRAGLSHGRPAIRDMCWDGDQVRLIDFECFQDKPRGVRAFALDVMVFTHSWFARARGQALGPELDAAIDSYLAQAPDAVGAEIRRFVRWIGPVVTGLATLVLAVKPTARDWSAIDGTLRYLRQKFAA